MSEETNLSVVDLKGFGPAAAKLIEKISDGVGKLYEPTGIVRKAKAEAKVLKIEAEAQFALTEIQSRGLERMIKQEERKQLNYENIVAGAIDFLADSAEPENIDNDWLAYFFEQCGSVSDEDIQVLWSKILAAESEKSGSFSKRTLQFVATMSKDDAIMITELCQFQLELHDDTIVYVPNLNVSKFCGTSLNFSKYQQLQAIGFVNIGSQSFHIHSLPDEFTVKYFGNEFSMTPHSKDANRGGEVEIGQLILTDLGYELLPICGAKENGEFIKYVQQQWSSYIQ